MPLGDVNERDLCTREPSQLSNMFECHGIRRRIIERDENVPVHVSFLCYGLSQPSKVWSNK
jgi:hypothetical protein